MREWRFDSQHLQDALQLSVILVLEDTTLSFVFQGHQGTCDIDIKAGKTSIHIKINFFNG